MTKYDDATNSEYLVNWRASSAIVNNDWNVLKVKAAGETLTFYINDIEVDQITDESFSSGKVGVMIAGDNWDGENTTLEVDYATLTCITLAQVATTPPLSITSRGALGGGTVAPDSGAPVTARGVCWSESENPTTSDSCTVNGAGDGAFTSPITGLTPGAGYHVRAYAINS
ncbi:MAG: hypothetical protein GY869_28740, partial [Planctomycetes bacterium]|nr:hypothetical protein [Planctomycetota bacterium]